MRYLAEAECEPLGLDASVHAILSWTEGNEYGAGSGVQLLSATDAAGVEAAFTGPTVRRVLACCDERSGRDDGRRAHALWRLREARTQAHAKAKERRKRDEASADNGFCIDHFDNEPCGCRRIQLRTKGWRCRTVMRLLGAARGLTPRKLWLSGAVPKRPVETSDRPAERKPARGDGRNEDRRTRRAATDAKRRGGADPPGRGVLPVTQRREGLAGDVRTSDAAGADRSDRGRAR